MEKKDWRIFTGDRDPGDYLKDLPDPPPWRPFGIGEKLVPPRISKEDEKDLDYQLARTFRPSPEMIEAVNAALYLRRPLLVTGKPGNGKSSLIRAVARELRMGPVLRWPITSKSVLRDGLYHYDALGRLEDQKSRSARRTPGATKPDADIGQFIELGALGTALLPGDWPRALLIDEIDKSDIDLPNDLLNIFEDGDYTITELARAKVARAEVRTWRGKETALVENGYVPCRQFPFVVMTSNREREFPPAFSRRCVRIAIEQPDEIELGEIVRNHFDDKTLADANALNLIKDFFGDRANKELATDQLLNAIYLVLRSGNNFSDDDRKSLVKKLYKPISGPEASR